MNKYLHTLLILFLLGPALISAQSFQKNVSKTGTTAAPVLGIPVGAQAIGMGGAFVRIANDATALHWNAAGIATLKGNEFAGVHTGWIAGTSFDFAGFVLQLGGFGSLGVSVVSLSMDDMKVRTIEKPEGTGEFFNAHDLSGGISYARNLTDRFTIGFTGKFIQQRIWHMSANAVAVDAGTLFRTDLFGGMVIGASISNFGTAMKLSGRDAREFYRVDPTKLGSNERIPFDVELDSWGLPLLFQLGLSTNILNREQYRWTIAADALHPNDNYESVNAGTEFAFRNIFFLRGGYHSLFLSDAEGGLSLGFGVASGMLFSTATVNIDYAYRDMGRLEGVNVFSLAIEF
ncbi:MAG: PorV/PorQ family protein [Calditrichia bacterium]